jgi:hypothetical protein
VSFALVVGVLAWIVTHPNKTVPPVQSLSAAVVDATAEPAASLTPPIPATPAVYRHHRPDVIAKNIPLIDETPPPLPSPTSRQPQPFGGDSLGRMPSQTSPTDLAKATPPQPAGETYGTQVLFLNNQTVAADMARRERRLLFAMHISGNFEDSCFT